VGESHCYHPAGEEMNDKTFYLLVLAVLTVALLAVVLLWFKQ
jgi:hypothetical protein